MIRSRVFVFWAIALFLAACLCAEAATSPENSKDKAEEKVTELQELTTGVFGTAKKKFNDADGLKLTVESQKTKADNAELAVRTAAAAIKEKDRKAQADVVAGKATEELAKCVQLYNTAKEKADQASGTLNGFVMRARDLDNKAKNEILAASVEQDDYTNVIQNAATAKSDTETLSGQIGASTVLSEAEIALSALKDGAKKVQALKYQAESLVIVSNIETKMSESKTDIQNIQQKEKGIDTIVTEMNTKLKSAPNSLSSVLSSFCSTAEGQLRTVKKKVQEANKCNTVIQGKKTQLDDNLKTLMATDDESIANTQASAVTWQEGHINSEIEKIKGALEEAQNALSSAQIVQKQMQDTINKHNSQPGTKLNEGNPQDNVRTAEVTNSIQNGEAKNLAITETDQTALEKSKDTMEKTSGQPVDAHVDKTEQNKPTQLTDKQKQNPKDGNSELLNKDKVRNITKDITNNPLIGGEVPTRSASNDSAVTVFIPLLVILVISAVLR